MTTQQGAALRYCALLHPEEDAVKAPANISRRSVVQAIEALGFYAGEVIEVHIFPSHVSMKMFDLANRTTHDVTVPVVEEK